VEHLSYREDLDEVRCTCGHGASTDNPIYLHPSCHPKAHFDVVVLADRSCIVVDCAECGETALAIAVDLRGEPEPEDPVLDVCVSYKEGLVLLEGHVSGKHAQRGGWRVLEAPAAASAPEGQGC